MKRTVTRVRPKRNWKREGVHSFRVDIPLKAWNKAQKYAERNNQNMKSMILAGFQALYREEGKATDE